MITSMVNRNLNTSRIFLAGLLALFVHGAVAEEFECRERNRAGEFLAQSRIVGGQDSRISDIPWQVVVYPGQYICGGSIISPSWILTAAHCMKDYTADQVKVAYGSEDLDSVTTIEVEKVFVHEKWSGTARNGNDIALLKLAVPLSLSENYAAQIQLVSQKVTKDLIFEGSCSLVSGWGVTEEDGEVSRILQSVDLPIVSRAECQRQMRLARSDFQLAPDQFCAGGDGYRDSCQGDSGGPIVARDPLTNKVGNNMVQLGVVSWGIGCARENLPGLYTDVGYHFDWIMNIYNSN